MNIKNILPKTIALALCLTVAFISCNTISTVTTSANGSDIHQIILDAGHGGFDGGAVASDGTVEKEINLKITLYLYDMLSSCGYDVILTRQTDTSTEDNQNAKIPARKKSDMKNRLSLMKQNSNSVFISIHLNKFTTSAARGSQVFYSGNNKNSKILGDYIQKSIISNIQPENTRVNKRATSSTYLLYNATIPAVLVECGFLSNKTELAALKTEDYQKKLAFCIFCGIIKYFSNIKEI